MIITKTPFRISFFGGGTDLNAWFRNNGGAVISTTIDKFCYVTCRKLPKFFDYDHRFVYSKVEEVNKISEISHPAIKGILNYLNWNKGIELHYHGDLPARSGLGSSSSFTVGMLNCLAALEGKHMSKFELASTAIKIEQEILMENVGLQDQIAASYGGFNKIEFYNENAFKVTPIILSAERLNELQDNLLLFFTGISRFASEIEKSKIDILHTKNIELSKMHDMVNISIDILTNSNINLVDFGLLLNEGWMYKKSLSNLVSNNEIDSIYNTAMTAGAVGGKILGAGGGGFILFYVPKEKQLNVIKKLEKLTHIPFKFENYGSTVALYQPQGL